MRNTYPELVLSSSSPARRELLARLPIPFVCVSPEVDETPLPSEEAAALVKRLSLLKAQKTAPLYPRAFIIGADQVGTVDGVVFSKPETHENAVQQLRLVSGKTVRFFTGLCLLNAATGQYESAVETYDVVFRTFNDEAIENYLHLEEALHCAGSLHVEGLGIALIQKFVGEDYTALIGLPLIRLIEMLAKMGVPVLKRS